MTARICHVSAKGSPDKLRAEMGGVIKMTEETDSFGPPAESVKVGCIHCARIFMSDEMRLRDDGLWGCKFDDCSGRGYNVDVWDLGHRFTEESFAEFFGKPRQK